jgi:hypothetical protein
MSTEAQPVDVSRHAKRLLSQLRFQAGLRINGLYGDIAGQYFFVERDLARAIASSDVDEIATQCRRAEKLLPAMIERRPQR